MKEFETQYETEAVCPHCGHEHSDSWELENGEYYCNDCEKPFKVVRNIDISYSTFKGE